MRNQSRTWSIWRNLEQERTVQNVRTAEPIQCVHTHTHVRGWSQMAMVGRAGFQTMRMDGSADPVETKARTSGRLDMGRLDKRTTGRAEDWTSENRTSRISNKRFRPNTLPPQRAFVKYPPPKTPLVTYSVLLTDPAEKHTHTHRSLRRERYYNALEPGMTQI